MLKSLVSVCYLSLSWCTFYNPIRIVVDRVHTTIEIEILSLKIFEIIKLLFDFTTRYFNGYIIYYILNIISFMRRILELCEEFLCEEYLLTNPKYQDHSNGRYFSLINWCNLSMQIVFALEMVNWLIEREKNEFW